MRTMFCGKQGYRDRNSQREGNIEEYISNILGEIKNIIIYRGKKRSRMQISIRFR